ncbi:ionotropic glutamate receptor, metazoa, Periplasmic binding protein-like I [Artemisia annua]|uniref:Ionotropic glutamate receptor, metazoa, Periplasmic binding protein-like I n=1 Tax=Artemisia annua TaxID=35608 RepID=A0A2U1LZB5_ARTAN|nr:ionotropic glutamate receptor, metazoa, Periplasmic binding protein-like I [Artemisia annua]
MEFYKDVIAIDLIESKQVHAIIGTISPQEATLVAEFHKATKTTPIISLITTAMFSLPHLAAQPSFLEMSHDLTTHMQCIAAIVGHLVGRSKYPDKEDFTNPSIHTLSTYDATWAVVKAMQVSKVSSLSEDFLERISHSRFSDLSGEIRFIDGKLANLPNFRIINVIGESYKDIGYWSAESGFLSDKFGREKADLGLVCWSGRTHKISTGQVQALRNQRKQLEIGVLEKYLFNKIFKLGYDPDDNETYGFGFSYQSTSALFKKLPYWHRETQRFLIGDVMEDKHKPLKVGVPAEALFNQFVNITYDSDKNKTSCEGAPLSLSYVLVACNGTYDDMVVEVHNKILDAAIGDKEITADRYKCAEFSQPFMETRLEMVVLVKRDTMKDGFIYLYAFTTKMWIVYLLMTVGTVSVVWLNEHVHGNEDFEASSTFEYITKMLWFTIAILSLSHSKLQFLFQ